MCTACLISLSKQDLLYHNETMSRLGLSRATDCVPQGPPDKRRKMDTFAMPAAVVADISSVRASAAVVPASVSANRGSSTSVNNDLWDDDFEMLLTQENLKTIDEIEASQQHLPNGPKHGLRSDDPLAVDRFDANDDCCSAEPQSALSRTSRVAKDCSIIGKSRSCASALSASTVTDAGVEETCGGSSERVNIERLLHDCKLANEELEHVKEMQLSKDGQIRLLNDKLSRAESDLSRQRMETQKILDQSAAERSRRESELAKENEQLKAQLQFKEQEILEVHNRLKRPPSLAEGGSRVTVTPLRSTRCPQPSFDAPIATQTATTGVGFPTTASFSTIEGRPSPIKQPNENNRKLFTEDQAVASSKTDSMAPGNCSRMKMRLTTKRTDGRLSMPQLCSVLLLQHAAMDPAISGSERDCKANRDILINPPNTQMHDGCSSHFLSDSCITAILAEHSSKRQHSTNQRLASEPTTNRVLAHLTGTNEESVISLMSKISAELTQCAIILYGHPMDRASDSNFIPTTKPSLLLYQFPHSLSHPRSPQGGSQRRARREDVDGIVRRCAVALLSLKSLVLHSGLVRDAVLANDSLLQSEAAISAAAASEENVSVNVSSADVVECNTSTPLDTIFSLIRLTRCRVLQEHGSISCSAFVLSVDVLTALARRMHCRQLDRLIPSLRGSAIVGCFKAEPLSSDHFTMTISAINLLTAVVRSATIAHRLCTLADNCLLLAVYNACCAKQEHLFQSTALHRQLIKLLAAIVTAHPDCCRLLLAAPSCTCSSKVIGCIVDALFYDYNTYENLLNVAANESNGINDCSSDGAVKQRASCLYVLRQGVNLLHCLHNAASSLFVERRVEVKHSYTALCYNLTKLFARLAPNIIRQHELAVLWSIAPPSMLPLSSASEDTESMESKDSEERLAAIPGSAPVIVMH